METVEGEKHGLREKTNNGTKKEAEECNRRGKGLLGSKNESQWRRELLVEAKARVLQKRKDSVMAIGHNRGALAHWSKADTDRSNQQLKYEAKRDEKVRE